MVFNFSKKSIGIQNQFLESSVQFYSKSISTSFRGSTPYRWLLFLGGAE
jgi:hypothetical protein